MKRIIKNLITAALAYRDKPDMHSADKYCLASLAFIHAIAGENKDKKLQVAERIAKKLGSENKEIAII